jgi:hypothetical protein
MRCKVVGLLDITGVSMKSVRARGIENTKVQRTCVETLCIPLWIILFQSCLLIVLQLALYIV